MTMETRARPRRWLWPALVASLMVNLLVLGAVAGVMIGSGHGRDHKGLRGFIHTLPEERRGALEAVMGAEPRESNPSWTELRAARRTVVDIVGENPLDRAKLDAALAKYSETDGNIRDARMRKFAEVVSRMTAAERRAFKTWKVEKRRGGWPWSKSRRHDRDGDRAEE